MQSRHDQVCVSHFVVAMDGGQGSRRLVCMQRQGTAAYLAYNTQAKKKGLIGLIEILEFTIQRNVTSRKLWILEDSGQLRRGDRAFVFPDNSRMLVIGELSMGENARSSAIERHAIQNDALAVCRKINLRCMLERIHVLCSD